MQSALLTCVRRLTISYRSWHRNMPKEKNTKKQDNKEKTTTVCGPVFKNKSGNVLINIQAKPGAKINAITDIDSDRVGIQINAPPVDGEANDELLKFMSSVLGLKKSEVSLEKGSKSRQKTVMVSKTDISIDDIEEKLKIEMQNNR